MSDGATKANGSHPNRLAFRMLLGAILAFVIGLCNTAIGDGSEWSKYAPFFYAIIGALIGLCVDLYTRATVDRTRSLNPRAKSRTE